MLFCPLIVRYEYDLCLLHTYHHFQLLSHKILIKYINFL